MQFVKDVKAFVLGDQPDVRKVSAELQASSVPITSADCRTCADPCDAGHEEYPGKFVVDLTSEMMGSVKPYQRQVVISTGKSDWEKEVTEAQGSLASYLVEVQASSPVSPMTPRSPIAAPDKKKSRSGLIRPSDSNRTAILNGSHRTLSESDNHETVLVFPDFKVITEVPRDVNGARDLYQNVLDVSVAGRGGTLSETAPMKSWVLPYARVILLCSHKKRDNRCAIAAPKLETTFIHALEHEGWQVHTQLEHTSLCGDSLEHFKGTPQEKEDYILEQLKTSSSNKTVLILKCSHTGGHKFAGNAIIYFPRGSGVWYGRLTPHYVESVVKNTIIEGKILPALFRGGLDVSRPGSKSLLDW